jgi:rubrerythrin
MGLITGKETGSEMLAIVYGMEEGMRSLYERLGGQVSDEEAVRLFRTLSELEVHHKQMIFDLYREHGGEIESVEAMDEKASSEVTEAGISVQDLVESFFPSESPVEDILGFAMMLEAQALDLYLRYWKRSEDLTTQAVLLELADQEETHLGYLGALLEKKVGES